jgi:hypothetical protein
LEGPPLLPLPHPVGGDGGLEAPPLLLFPHPGDGEGNLAAGGSPQEGAGGRLEELLDLEGRKAGRKEGTKERSVVVRVWQWWW